jgi:hypothetical protein
MLLRSVDDHENQMARKNKTKKEVVVDIKASQETDRIRKLVRERIYPFLLELNKSIAFSKIFLQVSAVTVDTAFNNLSKDMKVKELIPKFEQLYSEETDDNKMYMKFFKMFENETIQTFVSLMETMPRMIEKYYTAQTDKGMIIDLPIDQILG